MRGQDIGKMDEIMIDTVKEQVAYAVLSFCGFLGITFPAILLLAAPILAAQAVVAERTVRAFYVPGSSTPMTIRWSE